MGRYVYLIFIIYRYISLLNYIFYLYGMRNLHILQYVPIWCDSERWRKRESINITLTPGVCAWHVSGYTNRNMDVSS